MKKSRHLPFYLPNSNFNDRENESIFDTDDNLYNNPLENEGQTFTNKKQDDIKSKKREKERFDEI